MGFGNPYGDPYDVSLVGKFVDILNTLGSDVISLADTIGISNPVNIHYLFSNLTKEFPKIELGAHLHSNPNTAREKIEAAFNAGCRRFDSAIRGYGGCPMANDDLVGNIATETLVSFFDSKSVSHSLNREALIASQAFADSIFPGH
jgi:hydroxymethylglutaryl-CoA lyase